MSRIPLSDLRDAMAAALEPRDENDPDVSPAGSLVVLENLVDSLTPPALLLEWSDPWLVQNGMAGMGGWWEARVNVICFAGRVTPGAGVDILERLMRHVIGRLADDPGTWPFETTTSPRRLTMGGVDYLASRITYRVPVAIEGSTNGR
jgi:hypothetical protein